MKKIYYLGYYDVQENSGEKRVCPLAAVNKMTYICSAINRAGYGVEIVSASRTAGQSSCPGHRFRVSDATELKLFPCLGTGKLLKRVLRAGIMQWKLFWYLWKNTEAGKPLLAYHSLGYVRLLWLLKKLKGFRLILEVEEIYADVTGDARARRREMRLFKAADAYLFPSELLNEKINTEGKPSAIVYGTYQVEDDRYCKRKDGKRHLLYAGTFDPRKGALTAVSSAEELPEEYHIHILGFGSEEDTRHIKEEIARGNHDSKATVTYDGLLSGEEYIRFVQSCDVGFSTQMPDAAFNDTSFPSKVLSYLANGLRVVSVRIKALERSAINDLLYYYDENTPVAIARAVQGIDFTQPYDSRAVLRELDEKFVKDISQLIEKGNQNGK